MQAAIIPDLKKSRVLDVGIKAREPNRHIGKATAVCQLTHNYADSEDRMITTIIVAMVGAAVGTGAFAAGITVLVWWLHHHFCKVNAFIRRIDDLDWLQHTKMRKICTVPEAAHGTLERKRVSLNCSACVNG